VPAQINAICCSYRGIVLQKEKTCGESTESDRIPKKNIMEGEVNLNFLLLLFLNAKVPICRLISDFYNFYPALLFIELNA
jgi:hypothetical protein